MSVSVHSRLCVYPELPLQNASICALNLPCQGPTLGGVSLTVFVSCCQLLYPGISDRNCSKTETAEHGGSKAVYSPSEPVYEYSRRTKRVKPALGKTAQQNTYLKSKTSNSPSRREFVISPKLAKGRRCFHNTTQIVKIGRPRGRTAATGIWFLRPSRPILLLGWCWRFPMPPWWASISYGTQTDSPRCRRIQSTVPRNDTRTSPI
jgi:hypothetical protein